MNERSTDSRALFANEQGAGQFPIARLVRAISSADPDSTLALGQPLQKPETMLPSAYRSNSEVWRLILTDKLTGLCNRHGFIALADQQWRVSRRDNQELVCVGLEVANLAEINKRFERGDSELAEIATARILIKTFRRSDILCRWEGGAFRVLAVDAEGLTEPMVKARILSQMRKAEPRDSRYPLALKGHVARINPRSAHSFENVLASLDRDFADFRHTWCGAVAV